MGVCLIWISALRCEISYLPKCVWPNFEIACDWFLFSLCIFEFSISLIFIPHNKLLYLMYPAPRSLHAWTSFIFIVFSFICRAHQVELTINCFLSPVFRATQHSLHAWVYGPWSHWDPRGRRGFYRICLGRVPWRSEQAVEVSRHSSLLFSSLTVTSSLITQSLLFLE